MNDIPTRTKVLVAEDEPNIRQYVSDILAARADLEVVCVANGEAAVEAMSREEWDIVLTDQRMGLTDGIVVLQQAAALQPRAQRVMMTGFAEVPLVAHAKNVGGVHRFIAKPFSPSQLLREVDSLAEIARARRNRDGAFERALASTRNP